MYFAAVTQVILFALSRASELHCARPRRPLHQWPTFNSATELWYVHIIEKWLHETIETQLLIDNSCPTNEIS